MRSRQPPQDQLQGGLHESVLLVRQPRVPSDFYPFAGANPPSSSTLNKVCGFPYAPTYEAGVWIERGIKALYSFATKVFRSVSKRLVSAQKCNFYGLKFFIFTFLSGNHP